MASVAEELESLYKFANSRVRTSNSREESLDELYAEWRANNPSPELLELDVRAVRAAIRDMEAGEIGRPVSEFITEFRQENGWPM